jgi:uncharacterized protein YjlB
MNIETIFFKPGDWVPNNPHLPVLLYRGLFADAEPTDFGRRFAANGWIGIWINGVLAAPSC